MEQTDLDRIEQQMSELELVRRAAAAAKELIRIVHSTPYEHLDREMADLLKCSLSEATMIRHLPLDRLSPFKIARISAELDELRQHYADQERT